MSMKVKQTIEEIWAGTKDILLPYEGSTSQLHMLDVPNEHLNEIVKCYLKHVRCDGVSYTTLNDGKQWQGFTAEARNLFYKKDGVFRNWIFQGSLSLKRSLRLFVDEDGHDEKLSLELVFWADEFFPSPESEIKCLKSFRDLIDIANALQKISPNCDLAFDAYEAGNPRERKKDSSTYFW